MTFEPIRPPQRRPPTPNTFYTARIRQVSENYARGKIDTDFVVDEDGRFFEIVPTPSEPERAGDVASGVSELELTIYEILEQVKKRAKEGRGWRTFQRVRFHAFVPAMTGVQSQAWDAAVGEAYALERAYRADLRDRICGLLDDYGVKPNEDGWRTLSKIAMREAERLNIELSEPPDDSLSRSYAIRLAVQLAARSPDEIAASFRAFQIAPPKHVTLSN